MLVEPTPADFARTYEAGAPQVVWTRLVADLETPVSAMLKLSAGRANCFLLELVEGGAVRGRYSIIGIEPDLIFRAFGAKAEINADPQGRPRPLRADGRADARRAPPAHRRIPHPPARRACRRCRPASSAISATTWSARWRSWARPIPIRSASPTRSSSARPPSSSSTRSRTRSPSSRRSGRCAASSAELRPIPAPSTA